MILIGAGVMSATVPVPHQNAWTKMICWTAHLVFRAYFFSYVDEVGLLDVV